MQVRNQRITTATLTKTLADSDGWVVVNWDNIDHSNWYRIAMGSYCDLRLPDMRLNTITSGSFLYSTVTDVPLDGQTIHAHIYYLPVPSGWKIAPDSAETRSVIMSHRWSTHVAVMASGMGIRTKNFEPAGAEFGDSQPKYVKNSQDMVNCPWQSYQIIIVKHISTATPPSPSQSLTLFDDFQSSTLRSDLWSVVLVGGSFGASYHVGAGKLVMRQRPIIRTLNRICSTLTFPVTISGSITINLLADFFQFYTRTNAVPSGCCNEISDGISFYIGTGDWSPSTLWISTKGSSSDQLVSVSASTWRPQVGVTYSYRIVDAGSYAQLYIDNTLMLTLSNIQATFMPGGYVAMYNRETYQA